MFVRGKRREKEWYILTLKVIFSHESGISLMVEQEISNLLVGVRFSHPAQTNKVRMSRTRGVLRGESKAGGRRPEAGSRKFLARNYA